MPDDADRAGTPAGVFGAELRFYRTRAGLSQQDLAARATVWRSSSPACCRPKSMPARSCPPAPTATWTT